MPLPKRHNRTEFLTLCGFFVPIPEQVAPHRTPTGKLYPYPNEPNDNTEPIPNELWRKIYD